MAQNCWALTPRPIAMSLRLVIAVPCDKEALAAGEPPPSNCRMVASMQCLANKPSALATNGVVCTTLGGVVDTPTLILRISLQSGVPAADAGTPDCKEMRKINVGVSTTPPNVVHTTPFVAKALGLFAKHCIDATILQFEGGGSPAAKASLSQGTAITNLSDIAIGRGVKACLLYTSDA